MAQSIRRASPAEKLFILDKERCRLTAPGTCGIAETVGCLHLRFSKLDILRARQIFMQRSRFRRLEIQDAELRFF